MAAAAFAARKTALAAGPAFLLVPFFSGRRGTRAGLFVYGLMGFLGGLAPWTAGAAFPYGWVGVREFLGLGASAVTWQWLTRSAAVVPWAAGWQWKADVIGWVAAAHVVLLLAALAWAAWVFRGALAGRRQLLVGPVLAATAWLASLAALYMTWPTFLPDYAGDFLPAATLLAALMVGSWPVLTRRLSLWAYLAVSAVSLYGAIVRPWTGQYAPEAVSAMAAAVRREVPADERLFTAAVIVPYVTGHRVVGEVAHPMWYTYAFVDPKTSARFLPPRAGAGISRGSADRSLRAH